jgi:hypothetical protein
MLQFDELLDRIISPRPLLAGVIVGFVACAALGHLAGQTERIHDFTRFPKELSYLTNFQPSASQVLQFARTSVHPDQIAVVITGNSILHGCGQGAQREWTRRLQAELGARFRVINFAMPGMRTTEFGNIAAEMLYRDGHHRMIIVTNNWLDPHGSVGEPDGRPIVHWFFWDAHARGLLLDCPERDARLAIPLDQRSDASVPEARDPILRAERMRQASIDSWLNFRELWNAFEYEVGVTVRCKSLGKQWWQARKTYPDSDPECPPATPERLKPLEDVTLQMLRKKTLTMKPFVRWTTGEPIHPDRLGGPFPAEESLRAAFPEPLRQRLIVIANRINPYYLSQLTPDERATYDALGPAMVAVYARAGVEAMEVGREYGAEDYWDNAHLTAACGQKLAVELAPRIRQKAAALGYLEEPQQ